MAEIARIAPDMVAAQKASTTISPSPAEAEHISLKQRPEVQLPVILAVPIGASNTVSSARQSDGESNLVMVSRLP